MGGLIERTMFSSTDNFCQYVQIHSRLNSGPGSADYPVIALQAH